MPIPQPNPGESRNDFMSRCMSNPTMIADYPEASQRTAICSTQFRGIRRMKYECPECKEKSSDEDMVCAKCGADMIEFKEKKKKNNLKLETRDLPEVEIMETGEWKGHKYTEKDLDEAVVNFNNKALEPYLNIDHDDKLSDQMRRMLRVMSMGFVSKLWRKGTKLLASFKQVPKLIAELIVSGALKKRSVEWWLKYKHANGKMLNNVLEAVTFHGANGVPAVNTLADVTKMFKAEFTHEPIEAEGEKSRIDFKEEDIQVDEIRIQKSEYDELKAKAAKADEAVQLKADKEKIDTEVKEAKLKAEQAEEENKKLKKQIDDKETADLKAEAEEFVDKIINEKKLLPKYKDMKVAEYIRLKKEKTEDNLNLFKEEMETKDKILNFGALKSGEMPDAPLKFKSEDGDVSGDPTERAEETIQAIMKRDNISYEEAAVKAGIPGAEGMFKDNSSPAPEFGGGA